MADKLLSELLKGTYSGATPYTIGDIVDYNGSSYACKANTTGNLPTNTTYWALLAEKGATGDTGANGADGATGATGATGAVGINWLGTWSAGTYNLRDGVYYQGSSYFATTTTTETPSPSATDWDLIAEKGADGAGLVDSVSGTTNRITSTGGSDPIIDIDAAYVGQASITTLGTITTGVWNAGAVTSSGLITGTAFVPTSSTIPTNGMYLSAANTLGFGINSAAEVILNSTNFRPAANDGNALGVSGTAWADLFLASGAVINFAAGNVTLTHSTGSLTLSSPFSIGTGNAFTAGSIELGAVSDTTIARSAAGQISVEGVVIPTISSTNTLTNKRVTKRTGTTTSSATPTINTDNVDYYSLTAQAADITSFTTNLSGTPTENQTLWISITGTATRAITWGASFEASTIALPTTTVSTNRLDVGFVWNTVTSKWRCVASA